MSTTHTREFFCVTCDPKGEKPMKGAEIKTHLQDVHKLASMKGKKQGVQFLDGADFYSNTFKWTFECEVGQLEVVEISSGPRRGGGS